MKILENLESLEESSENTEPYEIQIFVKIGDLKNSGAPKLGKKKLRLERI